MANLDADTSLASALTQLLQLNAEQHEAFSHLLVEFEAFPAAGARFDAPTATRLAEIMMLTTRLPADIQECPRKFLHDWVRHLDGART
jgi:hypothetical protein